MLQALARPKPRADEPVSSCEGAFTPPQANTVEGVNILERVTIEKLQAAMNDERGVVQPLKEEAKRPSKGSSWAVEKVMEACKYAECGAEGQNRTVDTSLFRAQAKEINPMAYQFSVVQQVTFRVVQYQLITRGGATCGT